MAIPIIKPRERKEDVEYFLAFDEKACPGAGYWFECDAAGVVVPDKAAKAAEVAKDPAYSPGVIQRSVNRYVNAAVARCGCGRAVVLDDPMENGCACGKAYNMGGQEVIPNYGRAECVADGWAYDEDDY